MDFDKSKTNASPTHALASLPRDDLDLIAELVLHSGSLKDLAISYGVSYPTIRIRLDRVIQRLRDALAGRPRDPLAELLATLVERGELSLPNARTVQHAANELLNAQAPGQTQAHTQTQSHARADGSVLAQGSSSAPTKEDQP